MKVSPYRRSSLLLPSAWWHVLLYLSRPRGLQFKSPLRCLCEPAGPWAPLPLGGPMRGLRWGCRPVLLLVWYRSSFGMGCHSWRHAELSTAQGRLLSPQAAAQDVLFRVAWAHFCRAGRETAPLCLPARVRGASQQSCWAPEGFARPLPVLSSWGCKSHRGLRGSYPTHSHLNLSAVGRVLGASSASLGSHHFWNPRCPAGGAPPVAPPLPKQVGCACRVWSQWWALYHSSALDRPQPSGKSADTCTYDAEDMRRQGMSPNCTSQARLNPHASYTRLGLTGTISWY